MAATETAISITINGETLKLDANDAWAFAWHITRALECAVDGADEAYVVLSTFPGGKTKMHSSSFEKMLGR